MADPMTDSGPRPPLEAMIERLGKAGAEFTHALLRQSQPAAARQNAEWMRTLAAGFANDPAGWRVLQERLYAGHARLWQQLAADGKEAGDGPAALLDRRFRGAEWRETPYFRYLAETYLLNAQWLADAVEQTALEPRAKARLRFYTRQLIEAAAPANSILTNPEALKLAAETQGASLARGLENLSADLAKGHVTMTDEAAFRVGHDLAVSPGAVVFENEVMQLLQYVPATDRVHARPLVMVPPCINKYYILDLQPANSFVQYAVEQGHTVFMVSWKNAKAELAQATWDDYVEKGVLRALGVARDICGTRDVNALGFCIGGTLLGCALAVLAARGDSATVASATFLTTMLDFSDTGELDVFVDEAYVEDRERDFAAGGIFRGRDLMLTFSSLRPNDLIWPYVVNNYLKGGKPPAFDLLYWNSDSTNLAGPMYAWYVRNTYLENSLRTPGKVNVCAVPLDLGSIPQPAYVLATREDHIVPWRTAYASTQLLKGPLTFALAASGHIAGVVNPAHPPKRNFWTAPGAPLPADAEDWLAGAQSQPGSWWPHWIEWLAAYGGGTVPARFALGNAAWPVIEAAPGRYVLERCD
ncbi:MAG: class I poly(R)-hydroxyalkanoic acid synthase [Burkholderiales bacterium]